MATSVGVQQDNSAAVRAGLHPAHASGTFAGFGNMFNKEMGDWFGTRRWIIQTIIWLLIINGFTAFVLWVVPMIERQNPRPGGPTPDLASTGMQIFISFVVQLGTIGVIILAQDEVIGEKQTGTAQWVLSKPISRFSFILSKLSADMICTLLFIIAIPAIIGYGEVWLAKGAQPDLGNFLQGLGVAVLSFWFYLTMVIMLGVLFNERAPVLGIAFGVMFGGSFLTLFVSQAQYVLPLSLPTIAQAASLGLPTPDYAPYQYVGAVLWGIAFTAVALLRFRRQEL